jgi:rod shape-determining protein MreD
VAILRFLLALAAAAVADTLLCRVFPIPVLDPWLLVVLVYAIRKPPPQGTLAGAGAGLAQDALGSCFLGMHGFTKALAGYLCHALAGRLLLTRIPPRLLIAAVATVADRWALAFLQLLLGQGFTPPAILPLLLLVAGNALAAVALLALLDRLRGVPSLETA